ncbi:MAG: hypothetical protein QGF24_10365 [Dehalococcoidia bacterium]|nr:hypothetical protein [Dehalococcoidia bacterium]
MTSEDHPKVLFLGDKPRVAARSESESRTITVYGSPSINGRRVGADDLVGMESDLVGGTRSLDGEFVLVSKTGDGAIVASDRFASKPLFYLTAGDKLIISFAYSSLWKWLSDNNRLNPDPFAFYEFLYFQRLFGETTLDQNSKALPPASLLSFNSNTGATSVDRYWIPDFSKRLDGRKAIASDLADTIRASVTVKTSDATSPSLLLSGGMDSRTALGGFPETDLPHCITIGETENNEVDVARSLANLINADHSFVQRSENHYAKVFQKAVATAGGMYSFQHGHFFDLDIPETDLILHGHGFDYFFQGMYLPSTRKKILGRPSRSYSLDTIGFDLVGEYIEQAKYRLKGINPLDLLKPDFADQATDKLRADLESVLAPTRGNTVESFDEWDYPTTSAPGRHYTYLNLLSAGSIAEQRTIAFTNDIFDIYYSTPAIVRYGTLLLAETIKHLNPRLLEIRNANTNLRPDLSPATLTLKSWTRGLKRRLGAKGSGSSDPSVEDRSWPSGAEIIRNSEELNTRISQLHDSPGLASLQVFDETKIKNLATKAREGNANTAAAILSLLTIDEFLSPQKQR